MTTTLKDRLRSDVSNIFVGPSDFTDEGVFTFSAAAGEKTVNVLFDKNFEPVDQFAHEITATGPAALGSVEDLCDAEGNLPQSDANIVIDEVTYYVTKAMPYGDLILLQLSEEPAVIDE